MPPGHPKGKTQKIAIELQIKKMIETLFSIKMAYELVLVDPIFNREIAGLFYIFFVMI